MNLVSFAVVGYGHIGRRHVGIISKHPDCRLLAIVDPDPQVFQNELFPPNIKTFESLADLYQAGIEPDVVNIAAPNGLHCELALEALKAGSHVVIEKPMGISKAECDEVVKTAEQVNRHVFVVKQNRYSPPSAWLKEVVEQKIIGEVLMVQINCYWNRDERYYQPGNWLGTLALDGGTLYTQFSHFIDIMYWVFGDITDIRSSFRNFTHQQSTEFEDSGVVQFSFENGGIGSLNFSTSVYDRNME